MSLLQLCDIGKIYVSEKNVTVGIREVNLSFDRGEFVAVTGKSGSGKSTLLNVISGMDSYEEGELYINGEPTSHYMQPDWEEYREKYISFIFQDYNIIDSFTVLENVELALMHIEDRGERRKRALELIDRVGLSSHVRHKGSRLSGGQKQRTVIARALAKDSPVILADEPTGNLDSQTSEEIIELLRRVSEDKLVIVVTHDFDDFSHCATRHIRIHDGFVEFDHLIKETPVVAPCEQTAVESKKGLRHTLKNGFLLGVSIFRAKPRLTLFLCLLMIIGTLGIFSVTATCGGAAELFRSPTMFTHIDGRLVLTTQSGRVISESELKEIADKYGAESYMRYDALLDGDALGGATYYTENNKYGYLDLNYTYDAYTDVNIIGRYPQEKNELLLRLPISYQPEFGKDEIKIDEITLFNVNFTVTGISYYYDNNLTPVCCFTEEGFALATAASQLNQSNLRVVLSLEDGKSEYNENIIIYSVKTSFDIGEEEIFVASEKYDKALSDYPELTVEAVLNATYYRYDYFGYYGGSDTVSFSQEIDGDKITDRKPSYSENSYNYEEIVISDELMLDIASGILRESYRQCSLFFESDKEAYRVAELLREDGFIAVPSDTTYSDSADMAIIGMISALITAALWILAVVFLAFFINLCSLRSIETFKSDIAIMRSMGIGVKVIKAAMYVRMILCLIPAFVLLILISALLYTSAAVNALFTYLYPQQYALIILGMTLLVVRITGKQISRLFGESVKKSLRGGEAE